MAPDDACIICKFKNLQSSHRPSNCSSGTLHFPYLETRVSFRATVTGGKLVNLCKKGYA